MNKKISLGVLFSMNILILISAFLFSIYSLYFNVSVKVIKTNVPGVIFGILVFYLGIRYLMMFSKLKKQLNESDVKFSWSNFRKVKKGEAK